MRANELYRTILEHINRNHPKPSGSFYTADLLDCLTECTPRSLFHRGMHCTLGELHTLLGIDPEKWNAAYDKMVSGEWRQLKSYPGSRMHTPEAYAARAVWLMTLPHISVMACTKIAYYESVDKLNREIETRTRYGRYLTNVMKIEDPQTHVEKFQAQTGQLPVSFVENEDAEGWLEVYSSGNIRSCMRDEPAVACYAAAAFGLPDNGLRLAYLGSKSRAQARCIVNERTKEYVHNYGDSALIPALEHLGYVGNQTCLDGVHLATWQVDDKYWAAPYVDDYKHREADLAYIDGIPCLRLSCSGDWSLDNTCGYVGQLNCCRDCEYVFHDDELYTVYYVNHQDALEAHDEQVCDGCLSANYTEALERGALFWVVNDEVIEVDGEYYVNSAPNLAYYGFVYSYHAADYLKEAEAVRSEFHSDWLPSDETVFSEIMDDYLLESESVQIGNDYVPEMCVIFDEDIGFWVQNTTHPYLSAEQLAGLQGTDPKSEGVPAVPVWQDIEDIHRISASSVVRLKPEFWKVGCLSGFNDSGIIDRPGTRSREGSRVEILITDGSDDSVRVMVGGCCWLHTCRLQVRGRTQPAVPNPFRFKAGDRIRVKSNASQLWFDAGMPSPGWVEEMDGIQGQEFEILRLELLGRLKIRSREGREWQLLPEWVERVQPLQQQPQDENLAA